MSTGPPKSAPESVHVDVKQETLWKPSRAPSVPAVILIVVVIMVLSISVPITWAVTRAASNSNAASMADTMDVPLSEGILTGASGWYVPIRIRDAPGRFLLDTGSTDLYIAEQSCVQADCGYARRFDASGFQEGFCNTTIACDPAHCNPSCDFVPDNIGAFSIRYLDGSSLAGSVYKESISLGRFSGPALFGAVEQASGARFFSDTSVTADGIVGFGRLGSRLGALTVFQQLAMQHDLPLVFSTCLTHSMGGVLTLGGSNPGLYEGSLQYLTSISQGSTFNDWSLDWFNMTVGGELLPDLRCRGCSLDTGTELLLVPFGAWPALRRLTEDSVCGVRNVSGVCHPDAAGKTIFEFEAAVQLTADDVALFPDWKLQLSDRDGGVLWLPVTPQQYLGENGRVGSGIYTLLATDSFIPFFGGGFLLSQYVEWDLQKARLGFATPRTGRCTQQDSRRRLVRMAPDEEVGTVPMRFNRFCNWLKRDYPHEYGAKCGSRKD